MNDKICKALDNIASDLDLAFSKVSAVKPKVKEAIALIDKVRPKLVEIDKALEDKP